MLQAPVAVPWKREAPKSEQQRGGRGSLEEVRVSGCGFLMKVGVCPCAGRGCRISVRIRGLMVRVGIFLIPFAPPWLPSCMQLSMYVCGRERQHFGRSGEGGGEGVPLGR